MTAMPAHDQPWLAFSRVRWQGGLERRLVRIFDDRIEVRAGRFAVDTKLIPMADVYDVKVADDGAVRIVVVPDDIVITEGTQRDRELAAELIRKNAPPPRPKPKPKPAPPPPPPPKSKPAPAPATPKAQPKPKAKAPQPRKAQPTAKRPPQQAQPKPAPQPSAAPPTASAPPAAPEEAPAPSSQAEPERPPVGVPEEPRRRRAIRALALLSVGVVLAAVGIVAIIGGFVFVIVRLVSG